MNDTNTGNMLLDKEDRYLLPVTINKSTGYAVKRIDGVLYFVHRLVADATTGCVIHHKNGNKLDNRKRNLSFVSTSQNNRLRKAKGWTKTGKSAYQVKVSYKNTSYYIGQYTNEIDAELAYMAASKLLLQITGIDVQKKDSVAEEAIKLLESKGYRIVKK